MEYMDDKKEESVKSPLSEMFEKKIKDEFTGRSDFATKEMSADNKKYLSNKLDEVRTALGCTGVIIMPLWAQSDGVETAVAIAGMDTENAAKLLALSAKATMAASVKK